MRARTPKGVAIVFQLNQFWCCDDDRGSAFDAKHLFGVRRVCLVRLYCWHWCLLDMFVVQVKHAELRVRICRQRWPDSLL